MIRERTIKFAMYCSYRMNLNFHGLQSVSLLLPSLSLIAVSCLLGLQKHNEFNSGFSNGIFICFRQISKWYSKRIRVPSL
uniref:Uncharacterized protein n=1 Tax=Glossina pallidipes TaxID=7398 RepID=A0A1A9ZYN7_GLOPL